MPTNDTSTVYIVLSISNEFGYEDKWISKVFNSHQKAKDWIKEQRIIDLEYEIEIKTVE